MRKPSVRKSPSKKCRHVPFSGCSRMEVSSLSFRTASNSLSSQMFCNSIMSHIHLQSIIIFKKRRSLFNALHPNFDKTICKKSIAFPSVCIYDRPLNSRGGTSTLEHLWHWHHKHHVKKDLNNADLNISKGPKCRHLPSITWIGMHPFLSSSRMPFELEIVMLDLFYISFPSMKSNQWVLLSVSNGKIKIEASPDSRWNQLRASLAAHSTSGNSSRNLVRSPSVAKSTFWACRA